ncbi:MAG: hypothetical protein NTU98_00635 [Bacteroidetes bacterium]|nr:hypothetical protein [Bacteroidota bacterium]
MVCKVNIFRLILLTLIAVLTISSCTKKEKISNDPSLVLTFSADTVLFDTVFTTVGSVTQRLMVHNYNNNKVVVSSIRLASAGSTGFSLNIDGTPANAVNDVEVPAGDSIFIFVRVTVNPTNQNNPLVITDSILFNTNGNIQNVKLVAWGQDARFYHDEQLTGNVTWDSLKPHVIYGFLRVDTGASLTIEPGTKLYFHKSSYLAVSHLSSLKVQGNLEHPVRFLGDRMDPYYRDLPGQWDGIYLEKGSHDNEINYAVIKNGYFGISVDSAVNPSLPMLKLDNTIIQNMIGNDLYAYATNVRSTNCVFGDCGSAALALDFGGSYDFRQLTIGNYWSSSVRMDSALYISNYSYDSLGGKIFNPLTNAYFGNVIVYGQMDDEITLRNDGSAAFNFTFDHCLLKTKRNTSDPLHYINCIVNKDPEFMDVVNYDYRIDSISPAIGKGASIGVLFDIKGVSRGSNPDIGAYQYVPD